MTDPRLYTIPQAAERLGYHRDSVYRLIKSGELRAVRRGPGHPWRVSHEALQAFIRGMETNEAGCGMMALSVNARRAGELLDDLRASGMSWVAIAEATGLSKSTVHRLRTCSTAAPESVAAVRTLWQTIPPDPAPSRDRDDAWRAAAACRGIDPELWFPTGQTDRVQAPALDICLGCPVRDACLDEALADPGPLDLGIRGATTEHARQHVRRGRWGRRRAVADAVRIVSRASAGTS